MQTGKLEGGGGGMIIGFSPHHTHLPFKAILIRMRGEIGRNVVGGIKKEGEAHDSYAKRSVI